MIPIFILHTWLLGFLALGILGAAGYLAYDWHKQSWGWDPVLMQSVFEPHFGANMGTFLFGLSLLLAVIALFGGVIVKTILRITRPSKPDAVDPRQSPEPTSQQRLRRADGSELHVAFYGPEDGIPIVLTHGWGLHSREWNYLKRELADKFRLIVWDEPGLGKSTRPTNRDYSIENLARSLDAVLALAGDKPAILLGHSIGGMIILTFCRLFPSALGSKVAGLVLTHTTPTNPVRTTSGASFLTAIEKPVLKPLMWVTIAVSPLLWVFNWLSYRNGSAHLMNKSSSFGGTETWEQIDFTTKFQTEASPAVIARGMLGMMEYDALQTLEQISIPALVIAGDKDSTTKPEASERIRAGIRRAKLLTLAPAKHMGLIEHHAAYAKAVREFAHSVQNPVPNGLTATTTQRLATQEYAAHDALP